MRKKVPSDYWKKPKKLKQGRKKTKREFNETPLGYAILKEAPIEYRLIMETCGEDKPDADLIEAVSYASRNPFFKTVRFRMALIEYRETGLAPGYNRTMSPPKEPLRAFLK